MRDRPSPMEALGSNDFIERYAELFDMRAQQSSFTKSLIDWKAHAVFLTNFKNRDGKAEYQHVRAFLNLLNRGAQKKQTQQIFVKVNETLHKLGFGMEAAFSDRPNSPLMGSFKDRIEKLLDSYQTTYESFLRLVYAPAILAFRITSNRTSDTLKFDAEGLVRVAGIREIETAAIFPSSHFRRGINSALRNARAHRHYDLYGEDLEIEYWDATTPKTRISEEQIEALIDELFINCLGATDANLIWFMNHSLIAQKRKWIKSNTPIKLSFERYRGVANRAAAELGFDLVEVSRDKKIDQESMVLKTNPRGIDQTSQMFRGGDEWTESFDVDVKFVERPIVEQVANLLLYLSNLSPPANWSITVVDWETEEVLCSFTTKLGVVRSLERKSKKDRNTRVKKAFDWGTKTDETMFVKLRSEPSRATPRTRKPQS